MKKIVISIVVIVALAIQVKAQSPYAMSYIERTSVGAKLGTQLGMDLAYGFEVGAFYQQEFEVLDGEGKSQKPNFREREFYGIVLAGPIVLKEKYDVKISARTGILNGTNFVITPSLVSNFNVSKFLQLQGGLGIRNLRPSYQIGLRFHINK